MSESSHPSIYLSASPSSPIDWGTATAPPTTTDLVLQPGRQGDFSVLLRNDSTQRLQVYLSLRVEFPAAEWFTPDEPWHFNRQGSPQFNSSPFNIEPRQTLYKTLPFRLPQDFFEHPQALSKRDKLLLKYVSELSLYRVLSETDDSPEDDSPEINTEITHNNSASNVRLVGYQSLSLHTRPTRSYLEFLPEIYQQSDFLGRFLSITEQAFEPTYETTENFWAYLNPLTAPKALIPFLAQWVAWPLNPRWTLSQQRRLIRHAVEIYQWRGTQRGLQLCLHLCTKLPLDNHHIEITESDEAGFTIGDSVLGNEESLGGGVAYHFAVTLRPQTDEQAARLDEAMVREIIEQEKPAFCTYELTIESI